MVLLNWKIIPDEYQLYLKFTFPVKNLSDNDFKYLSEDFNPEQIKFVKQKGVYPYEYMGSFEKFSEDKLPDKKNAFIKL